LTVDIKYTPWAKMYRFNRTNWELHSPQGHNFTWT